MEHRTDTNRDQHILIVESVPNPADTSSVASCSNSNCETAKPPTYPIIKTGTPLPLICARPVAATKKLADRPNLQVMWENYIHDPPKGVWAEVGGMVELNGCLSAKDGGWSNACTVRLSHMLNAAGWKIPKMKGKTVTGGNGEQYLYRLNDARRLLLDKMGAPDLDVESVGPGRWFGHLPSKPGLVLMSFPGQQDATGHATVWNGASTVDGSGVGGSRVMFWALPCFVPDDRAPP